jgi:dual specificity phosphatase 12
MSYLLHGSTSHTGMGWVDLVPRCGRIFIGGLYALYQTDLIEAAGITHVLSVIDYDALLQEKFSHLKHLHIRAEDHPNTNILQYFERGVQYIDQALASSPLDINKSDSLDAQISTPDAIRKGQGAEAAGVGGGGGGGVFVHCAMGKSRSATLVCAYLIWKYRLSPEAALEQLCEGRPICDPNPGFKEQLEVWSSMCRAGSEEEKTRIYDSWEKDRFTGEVWDWETRVKEREREKATSLQASKL